MDQPPQGPVQPDPSAPPQPAPTNQTAIPKPKNNTRTIIWVVVVLLVGIAFGLLMKKGTLLSNSKIPYLTTTIPAPSNTPIPTFMFTPTPIINLPAITNRIPANSDYSSWLTHNDIRGYSFKYPNTWFLAAGNGEAQQTQNWNPTKVINPGLPLSGDQSKWDINFMKNDIQDISEILNNESKNFRIDVIERSKTIKGMAIYFIQGTGSFFGDENVRVPLVKAIVINNNQYFQWSGIYYGSAKNLEILKQIVESISIN